MKTIIGICCFGLLWSGCSSDNQEINVDPAFDQFVNEYITESQKRGINVDFSDTGLSIQFDQLEENDGGICSELGGTDHGSHEIVIDNSYWQTLSVSQQRVLIFHELGHCELGRIHANQVFSNGDWVSIMRGEPLPDKPLVVNMTGERWTYYLDEFYLFDKNTPEWVSFSPEYTRITLNRSEILTDAIENKMTNMEVPTQVGDFEILLSLDNGNFSAAEKIEWGGENAGLFSIVIHPQGSVNISSQEHIWGDIFIVDNLNLISQNESEISIIRSGDRYLLYINNTFIYWFQALNLPINQIILSSGKVDRSAITEVQLNSI